MITTTAGNARAKEGQAKGRLKGLTRRPVAMHHRINHLELLNRTDDT
jgi:hypothetical protein